ncbi:MAG: nitroreductase [Denitrovibrio sp.]|nr:MAG: nitroreductase [Denitrovibrio sp.]
MLNFKIDAYKCIKCGQCATDCPVRIISFDPDTYPSISPEKESFCMQCQHCLAICPTAALSILDVNPDECVPVSEIPTAEQVDALIRNRRSTRQFIQTDVAPEKINKLIKTVANAPTGKNVRNTTINIIDNIESMNIFVEKAISKLEELDEAGKLTGPHAFFSNVTKAYRTGTDIVFRGAPHLIVTSAPKTDPCPEADGFINLAYIELMATSMGLGVVWVGFVMHVLALVPELKGDLGIPDDHVVSYALLLGEPSIKYHRGVIRDEIQVNRVTLK